MRIKHLAGISLLAISVIGAVDAGGAGRARVVGKASGELKVSALQAEFERLARGFDGRVGVCAQDASGVACVNGEQPSSLQSVMKLVVGIAVMDRVDRGGWRMDDPILVRRSDLSLAVQPIAKLVTDEGYRTTIDDLVRRAVVDSDSAASDILMARLGGPQAVQALLARHKIAGMRIDRDERHLQTEILGLTWRPEYVDSAEFVRAVKAVPEPQRDAAYRAYQADPRDTSTPKAMAMLLHALAEGRLLSATSTKRLLDIMRETVTFPDRLKAGVVAPGWTLGHKTGTSGGWRGLTAATNDVGILTTPDGTAIGIAVFILDSRAPDAERAALMASVARATVEEYRQTPAAPKR